jgi:hypothetical protein
VELDRKLPAILRGEKQPADAAESLALAQLCRMPCKKHYAVAARLYAEAFAAGAALTATRSYEAACAAVLAAEGKGEDAGKLDAQEKTRLRRQALAWLREGLTDYGQQLEEADAQTRKAVEQRLRHWLSDPDLTAVRGDLTKLPDAERGAWRQLWTDVAATLALTEGKTLPEKKPDGK